MRSPGATVRKRLVLLIGGFFLLFLCVVIRLAGDGDACERYGCPREAELIYTFGDTVTLTLNWFDKDASRIPEAVWLGFNFKVDTPALWRMRKVDTWVDPAEVVRNGNRKQKYTNFAF